MSPGSRYTVSARLLQAAVVVLLAALSRPAADGRVEKHRHPHRLPPDARQAQRRRSDGSPSSTRPLTCTIAVEFSINGGGATPASPAAGETGPRIRFFRAASTFQWNSTKTASRWALDPNIRIASPRPIQSRAPPPPSNFTVDSRGNTPPSVDRRWPDAGRADLRLLLAHRCAVRPMFPAAVVLRRRRGGLLARHSWARRRRTGSLVSPGGTAHVPLEFRRRRRRPRA
jgi:hypothetical protein